MVIADREEEQTGSGEKAEKKPAKPAAFDGNKLKEEVYENLEVKEYNVEDLYFETGFWQALAKNDTFGNITLGIISFNAVWIGVDSDYNTKPPGETDTVFIIADQFFCVFFSFEWLTRFLAFKIKRSCLKDGWFKFDSVLVFLMVFETWITPLMMGGGGGGGMGDASMLRLLRLLRLTRMARLMRSVPELLVLLKGMAAAARSVFSTLALLIIFTYVFGIIFKQQTEGDEDLEELYGTIPEAMWNLLLGGTLLDEITNNLNQLREKNKAMCAAFLLWVLLSSFTILNMLIGVLCEVVSAVSDAEREKTIVSFAKSQFLSVLERIDEDKNGTLSEKEFGKFVKDPEVKLALAELEVDSDNLLALTDVIFSSQKETSSSPSLTPCAAINIANVAGDVSCKSRASLLKSSGMDTTERDLKFGELLEMILALRASNPAMVSHIVDLRKHLRGNQKETRTFLKEMDEDIETVDMKIEEMAEQHKRLETKMDEMMTRQDQKMDQCMNQITAQISARQDKFLNIILSRQEEMMREFARAELRHKIACENKAQSDCAARLDESTKPSNNEERHDFSIVRILAVTELNRVEFTPSELDAMPALPEDSLRKAVVDEFRFDKDSLRKAAADEFRFDKYSLRKAATDEFRVDNVLACDEQADGKPPSTLDGPKCSKCLKAHQAFITSAPNERTDFEAVQDDLTSMSVEAGSCSCQPTKIPLRASRVPNRGKNSRR